MFGNLLGWRISAILLVLALGGGIWLRTSMQMTAPTAISLDPKNLEPLAPPKVDLPQTAAGDAGEKYIAASAAYDDDPQGCDDFSGKPQGPTPRAMQLVVDAMGMHTMNLYLNHPEAVVDYQSDHPVLDNLGKIGQEMEAVGLLWGRAGKKAEARQCLLAVCAMGQNLVRERVNYEEYARGLGLMDGALTGLAELEPANSTAAQAYSNDESTLQEFDQERVEPVYEMLSSADPAKIAFNAGDVFRFATVAQERMFRVEATLKLGRYRFNAGRAADQLAVPRFLRRLAGDPDPAVRAAALAAEGLTVEQYRMIH